MTLLAAEEGAAACTESAKSLSGNSKTGLPSNPSNDSGNENSSHGEDQATAHKDHKDHKYHKDHKDNENKITYSEIDTQGGCKKNRLVSIDSGFGSSGPSELNVVAALTETPSINLLPAPPAKQQSQPNESTAVGECSIQTEKRDKLTPLDSGRRLSDPTTQEAKNREYRKNRTTTLTIGEDVNCELDVRLINRYDGLKDVLCYLDEDGAPKVREKPSKRRSTLRQELRNRNMGASLDEDALRSIEKKSSWVSFSRLCKKFKESFLSKFEIMMCQH